MRVQIIASHCSSGWSYRTIQYPGTACCGMSGLIDCIPSPQPHIPIVFDWCAPNGIEPDEGELPARALDLGTDGLSQAMAAWGGQMILEWIACPIQLPGGRTQAACWIISAKHIHVGLVECNHLSSSVQKFNNPANLCIEERQYHLWCGTQPAYHSSVCGRVSWQYLSRAKILEHSI